MKQKFFPNVLLYRNIGKIDVAKFVVAMGLVTKKTKEAPKVKEFAQALFLSTLSELTLVMKE